MTANTSQYVQLKTDGSFGRLEAGYVDSVLMCGLLCNCRIKGLKEAFWGVCKCGVQESTRGNHTLCHYLHNVDVSSFIIWFSPLYSIKLKQMFSSTFAVKILSLGFKVLYNCALGSSCKGKTFTLFNHHIAVTMLCYYSR